MNTNIRNHFLPTDIENIIVLHYIVYRKEYNYNKYFLTYVAEGLDEFLINYNSLTDGVWIVEDRGKIIGSIVIVGRSGNEAQLRYFVLLPEYRGRGIGKTLMQNAIDFCKNTNVKSVYLWTAQELTQATKLYKQFGFIKTEEVHSDNWGKGVVEEKYNLNLVTSL